MPPAEGFSREKCEARNGAAYAQSCSLAVSLLQLQPFFCALATVGSFSKASVLIGFVSFSLLLFPLLLSQSAKQPALKSTVKTDDSLETGKWQWKQAAASSSQSLLWKLLFKAQTLMPLGLVPLSHALVSDKPPADHPWVSLVPGPNCC